MSDVVQISRLVSMYLNSSGKVNAWFTRKMKETTPEVREEVWKQIRHMGLDRLDNEEAAKRVQHTRPKSATLTEEEWDDLAEKLFPSVVKHPTTPLVVLANKLMAQVPVDKRKKFNGHNIEPLSTRVKDRFESLLKQQTELQELKVKLLGLQSTPSKEEIIAGLSDEEVLQFSQRVIGLMTPHEIMSQFTDDILMEEIQTPVLVGKAVQRTLEMFQEMGDNFNGTLNALKEEIEKKRVEPKRSVGNGAIYAPPQLPKIALIGLKAVQFKEVAEKLADKAQCHYVDKNMRNGETIPNACNYVVVWTRHVPHNMQIQAQLKCAKNGSELVYHTGGTDTLVKKLETVLAK